MGNATGVYRVAVVLLLFLLCACARADSARVRFDIAAQPAALALNEFARQADATLIFSYDSVSNVRTRSLQGRYPVDEGIALLLRDTGLAYRKSSDGTYLICLRAACGPSAAAVPGEPRPPERQ
ncbi:STN domain-containing protein [Pseudoxanthomonas mexicana]|uniref:STN domain-containing protein n=1 Tax=Pseudoxanthomonas mexicana TaxID=128785 RepID=UPI00398A8B58